MIGSLTYLRKIELNLTYCRPSIHTVFKSNYIRTETKGWVRWLVTVIPALAEAKVGGS